MLWDILCLFSLNHDNRISSNPYFAFFAKYKRNPLQYIFVVQHKIKPVLLIYQKCLSLYPVHNQSIYLLNKAGIYEYEPIKSQAINLTSHWFLCTVKQAVLVQQLILKGAIGGVQLPCGGFLSVPIERAQNTLDGFLPQIPRSLLIEQDLKEELEQQLGRRHSTVQDNSWKTGRSIHPMALFIQNPASCASN